MYKKSKTLLNDKSMLKLISALNSALTMVLIKRMSLNSVFRSYNYQCRMQPCHQGVIFYSILTPWCHPRQLWPSVQGNQSPTTYTNTYHTSEAGSVPVCIQSRDKVINNWQSTASTFWCKYLIIVVSTKEMIVFLSFHNTSHPHLTQVG